VDASETDTEIIPGIQPSLVNKGVVIVMPSPTYDSSRTYLAGNSPIFQADLEWQRKEVLEYDQRAPKIVVNPAEIDALYAEHGVLLYLCGRRAEIQHCRTGGT
jgi:hypothetical protein